MGADGARYQRRTALKVTEATDSGRLRRTRKRAQRPPLDVIVMRSWGDWITGGPEPETSGPQNLQIIGALDALLQSTLSGQTETVNL